MKKAFTIPELIIIIAIVGIISVSMITIIKPNEKTLIYQYYNAYNTLSTAIGNIYLDFIDAVESNDSYYTTDDKSMPDTAKKLCERLAVNKSNPNSKYGYINTTKYNCSSFTPVSRQSTISFDEKYIAFQASNSMYYYISEPSSIKIEDSSTNNELTYKYSIVWVDLNGKRLPNTAKYVKKLPDIVPFVVTMTGKVIPIGIPATDKRYLIAQVEKENSNFSEAMTFEDAVNGAYGGKQYPEADLLSAYLSLNFIINRTYQPKKYKAPVQLSECEPSAENEVPPCAPKIKESIASF